MKWLCENQCGSTLYDEDIETAIEEIDHNTEVETAEDVGMILYPCPNCDELTCYERNNTSESQDSSNTTNRSKMLQAARS